MTRFALLAGLVFSLMGCSTFSKAASCQTDDLKYGTPEFNVDVTRYRSSQDGRKSLIILPPTGGTNYIDRSYAKQFCGAGYDVYIMNHWTDDTGTSTDLEIHQGFYSRMLKAMDLVLVDIKTPFVGLFGTSLGGLYASVAAAKIERFDAVYTVVAGTPIADIIVSSDQPAMRELAKVRRERYHFANDADYIAALNRAFLLEPTKQRPLQLKKKRDFGMVIAENDTTVPTEFQHQLREFWKPESVISLNSSHFWGLVKAWLYHDDEIRTFFDTSANRILN